jgi:thiamine transport system substrate-binding protein
MPGTRRTVAVIALVGLLLAACGSSEQSADAPDTVRLLTYDSYAISETTVAAFEQQTGLQVEIIRGSDAGEVVNRALLTKDNPEADALFGVDNTLLSRALDGELFVAYEAAGVEQIPAELRLDDRVTPIDTGEVCVNVDLEFFAEAGGQPPQSLAELAEPVYRDQLVVQDPAASSPGLAFLLATVDMYGEDGYLDYWQSLKNNGVTITNGWNEAYYGSFSGGSGEGDRPIVVSYATSPAAEVLFADPPTDVAPTAAILDGCYQQIEFAGVLRNAANPTGAEQLLDFMLTRTYQDDIPLNNFVYPALPGAALPAEFTEYAPQPSDPAVLPPEVVAQNRDRWVQEWSDLMRSG